MNRFAFLCVPLSVMLLILSCAKTDSASVRHQPEREPSVANLPAPAPPETRNPKQKVIPHVPAKKNPPPIPHDPPAAHASLPVGASAPAPQTEPVAAVKQPAVPRIHTATELVSLAEIDPTIIIDIQFSRPENPFHYQFFRENVAYVRYATAKKIAAVQRQLMREHGLRLKIWSAYRPMPVQVKMYDIVGRNGDWVSDPYNDKSKKAHVRGVAIDCTLVDQNGNELAMPTSYLDFAKAPLMAVDYMDLPPQVIANRTLLRDVMINQGMSPYSKEWWHFQDNKIMEFPAIAMKDFPELHRQMLVDEMVTLGAEFEASQAARAAKAAKAAKTPKAVKPVKNHLKP